MPVPTQAPGAWENGAVTEIELRRPGPDEFGSFISVPIESYGSDATESRVAFEARSNEIDRSRGVVCDGHWVAASGAFSMELTVPGGARLPAAGITMVGVAPTHRRRGMLTEMLRWHHDDARRRGEPVALLTASETSIYRRFGYGVAMDVAHVEVPAAAVRFDPPVDGPGVIELIDPHVDTGVLEVIHGRLSATRAGWLHLTPGLWEQIRDDPSFVRNGRTTLRGALHRGPDGAPDGYVTWRIEAPSRSDRLATNTLWIEQLVGLTPDVEAALWEFVAGIDLVTRIAWETAPVEPTIRWRLVEPRQLRTLAVADMVWARILDVSEVLSARTYRAAGNVTLDVTDRFHPDLGGRFGLRVDEAGATGRCVRSADTRDVPASDAPLLAVGIADLATIVVGGVAPSTLARAGRVVASPESLDLADALFAQPQRPWWPIEF